jgi:ligand-binding sensor domain-containing protein/two-component sensor histidine kinase
MPANPQFAPSVIIFDIPKFTLLVKRFSYLLLLLLALPAIGQQSRQYSFMHFTVSSGLASNEAISSLQDEQGFLWIATNKGLQRFDGQRYMTFGFQRNNPYAIPHNYIIQILFDQKKRLWVLTGDGKVGIFDTKRFLYSEVPVRVKNPKVLTYERELIQDEAGNIMLVYHQHEFLTWSEQQNEFSAEYNFVQLPADWQTTDCLQQPGTRKYWIAGNKGLAVFDRATNQLSYKGHNVAGEAIIERFGDIPGPTRIFVDKQERLWFDAWVDLPLLFCFDLKKKEVVLDRYSFLPLVNDYHELRGILQQRDGTIWIKGLNVFARYIEKEKKFQQVSNGYQNEQSIDYIRVNDFFEDRDGNVWVSTNNNGLYSFNPAEQFFTNIRQINRVTNLPGKGSMMSFILTPERTLLAGAWNDGLYRYDSNYRMLPLNIRGFNEKIPTSIWSMCYSPDSTTIWMGAQPGIYAYHLRSNAVQRYNPPMLKEKTIRQLVADKFGNLWIGTQSLGLFKWTATAGKSNFDQGVTKYKEIPDCQVRKILVTSNGYVWIATSDYGLYGIDPVTDKIVVHLDTNGPPEKRIAGNVINAIAQYDDSTLLVAGKNIHFFNLKREKISRTIKLPESQAANIEAIETDKSGYVWISLSNGIYRLNPRNQIFIHFDRIDGIMNDHFVTAASYTLPSGRIIFGADNQLVLFDPLKVKLNDPAPDVVISSFKLKNKPLLVDSLLKLSYIALGPEDNSLAIEFAGLGYGRAYIIKYQLQGIDKDWIPADNTNQAVYSYLPPGNYTLLLKSENAEGQPSKNITKLVIKIKPPFWRTWWFLGLAIFATVGLFYWIDKQRTQKIRATESIRTRIATSLTEDMSNSLSSINISSELAKNKIDTDAYRTKEYINQISDASNRMVQAMYDMVWSINPGNDNLPDCIARMKEFAAEVENSYDITIVFDVDKAVLKLRLTMEHRYELLSIFKEAVTNAARHANARNIRVNLRLRNSKLIMMVEDDGKGFDLETGVLGRGISDMRRRATAMDASFYVESNVNTGSIVKVEIPIF